MKKFDFLKTLPRMVKSLTVLMLTMLMTVSALFAQYSGTGTFVKINSLDELTTGYYVVTNQTGEFAMQNVVSTTSTKYILSTNATFSNPTTDIVWSVNVATDGTISLYNEAAEKYVAYSGSGNSAYMIAALSDQGRWTPSLDAAGNWVLTNVGVNTRYLSYNSTNPRFACYGNNGQEELSFYKLDESGALAAPQFSVAAGFKYEPISVTITGPAGASIYYTLDGTTPTTSSTLYASPIAISTTTTVNAIAVLNDEQSSVASAVYSFPVVATIADFRTDGASNVVYDLRNCTFVHKSGRYVFVKDMTGGLCIYDYNNPMLASYEEGDVIPHIYGTRSVYNGMVELIPTHETEAALINTGAQSPVLVNATDILNNYNTYEGQLVKIVGITFTGNRQFVPATRNSVTFNQNGSDNLYIYNAFSNLSVNVVTGQTADVIGFVAAYNTQKQLFPRNNADIMLNEVAVPYAENFDGETNDWHFLQEEQANQWYVGQPTGYDSKALFVSDNGVSNKYNITSAAVSHAYVDVLIPTSGAVVGCDYRIGGEGTSTLYDYLAVSLINPTDELEAGEAVEDLNVIAKANLTNGWQRAYFIIDGEDNPAVKRLVLTWKNDAGVGTQPGAAIDNITITAGTCLPVSDLAVSDIEATSATIAWANQNDVTWQVEYKTADEETWTTVSALANSVNLTGLTSNTEYTVRVKTVCSTTQTSEYATSTFTTESVCGTPENVTVTPAALTAVVNWTVTPNATYDVEFKKSSSSEWITIVTGATTAPVTLGGLAETTTYNVRVVAHCAADNGTATSDEVTFTTLERCPAPINLAGVAEGNQINVTWTSDDYFAQWILQYRLAGTDIWSSEITLNQPSYTISPIQSSASYQIRVKSLCENNTLESDYSSITVAVPCGTPGEDIDLTIGTGTASSYNAPYNNYYGYSWNEMIYHASEVGTAGVINSIAFHVNSASSYSCSTIKIYLGHTPKDQHTSTTDWSPMSDLTLVYSRDNISIGASTGWEERVLDVPFNYNGVDNLVVVVAHGSSSYTSSLNYNYTSMERRGLYRQIDGSASYAEHPGTGVGTYSSYLPNMKVNITECGDGQLCAIPQDVAVTNITTTSAQVNWTGSNNTYILKITKPEGVDILTVTGNSYILNNLTPNNTAYSVAVAAKCGENTYSLYSTPATFTTECEMLAIPYFQNFDGYTGTTSSVDNILPSCWSHYNAGTTYTGYPLTYLSSSYAASGSNVLRFYMYSSSSYADQYAILPYTDVAVNSLMLNFDMRAYSTSSSYRCELQVGVMSDPTDPSTFVSLGTVTSNSTSYNNYSIYLNEYTGNGHYIALKGVKPTASPYYNYIYLDNLTVDYAPTCSAPSITDYNLTTKLLTWTNGVVGTPQSYQVMCNVDGNTTNTYTFTTAEGLLLGLQPLSNYTVYVRSICGAGDTSEWSEPYYFTTPEAGCQDPSNLEAVVDANNNVTLTWDVDPEQNTWTVSYKTDISPIWSAPITVTGTPTTTISGLQTGATHLFRVSAVCNGGTSQSDYAYGSANVPCINYGPGGSDITIGTGTSTAYYAPFNNFYKNSRNEVIYHASQIGQAGAITGISYNVGTSASFTTSSINIYMGHTSRTSFNSTSDWTPVSDLQLVYSSTNEVIGASTGWENFVFDTPFQYNGNDNLVVVVTKSSSSYSSALKYVYTSQTNRCLYRQNDSNASYADINNVSLTGSRGSYVPNVKFSMAQCVDPVLCDATVNTVTATVSGSTATVNWTATGADSYVVEYGVSGFAAGTGTQVSTAATTINISGLDLATMYEVAVYPLCANGNVGTPAFANMTTGCAPIVVTADDPWLETFDVNYTGSGVAVPLDMCWDTPITSTQSNGTFPAVYTGYSAATYSGANSLEMKGSNQMVVLPLFANDINTLQFDFWANTTASSSSASDAGTMEVGVITDVTDLTTFVPVTTVPPTAFNRTGTDAAHANHVAPISFSAVTPQAGTRIAVRITGATSGNSWNLDNFNVSLIGGVSPVEPDVVIMGQTTSITTCNATIYDNGGATGDYQTSSYDVLDITPATPGASLHITGSYDMEDDYDYIYIYDANNTIVSSLTGEGTLDVTISGAARIMLESDYSLCYSGFAFQVECVDGGDQPEQPDTYVMGDVSSVTTCNAIIYDNGGANGNYETYSDDLITITPEVAGANLHIYGSYNMESNYDYIYIYDANNVVLQSLTGDGTLDIVVNGPASIGLQSDGSVCYSGFEFHVECQIPENINTEVVWAGGLSDACDLSGQHITVNYSNNGLDVITSMVGSFSVNGGAPVTETFTTLPILPGEVGAVTFTTPVVFDQTTNDVEVILYADGEPSTLWDNNTYTITGIDEVAPMTAPYDVLPVSGSSIGSNGWIAYDIANNGLAWTISGTVMNAPHNDNNEGVNNWLVTPCYDLPAGIYKVTYDYKVNNAAIPESFAVYYGQGNHVADMTNLLAQYPNIHNDSYITATHIVTIPADGNYNFGFLANSPTGGLGMSVKALTVTPMVTMTALSSGHGTITPSGNIVAGEGEDVTFVMNPDEHYYLNNITVNGQVVATYNNTASGVVYTHTVANNDVLIANFTRANLFTYVVNGGQGYVNGNFYTAPVSFTEEYANGENTYITFVPDVGYHVENVNINGIDYGPITDWVITNISQDYTFIITFAPNTYVVTTTAYGNGTVSDGAIFVYNPANTYTFSATPGANAHIASILRNNEELTITDPFNTYTETLTNILSNYDYVVYFDPNNYTVEATAGNGGTITPAGVSNFVYNTDANYYIEAAQGYYIDSVTVDGVAVDYTQANALTAMSYTFPHISANHTISVVFAQYEYTITVNAGEHGTITPGTTVVGVDATPTFTITPEAGYGIADVTVDNVSVGAVNTYTFAPVSANHTIAATFAQYQYTITANAGNGGTITPNGVTNMVYNGNQTYTITASAGYHIADVYVDGVSVGAVNTYTFTGVTANHTIYAVFGINEYTITVTQPNNGNITPGTTTVQYGATPSFVITPNTGYNVTAITLNGSNVISSTPNVNGVYTLTLPAVTANATLTATMTAKTYTITASAGTNGTISPSGVATVNFGQNKSYTFNPANGYEVAAVTVDGMNMGAISSYTFVNVVANHTINVTFKLQECELPTNMQTIFVDTTSATLYWYHAGAVSYDIQYKAITDNTFTTTNTTQTTYNLTGLTPGTTYIWMVRANCVANNPSNWTNGCTFRTLDAIVNPDGIEDHIQSMISVYSETNNVYIVNENGIRIDNVQIYDVYGKLLYNGNMTSSREVISMNVATGTYLVRLATEYGTCNYKLHLTK